jgi:hypothetical protein
MENKKELNVIICGVLKNGGKYLDNSISLAIQLGNKCNKYKFVIYENNSSDSTKSILMKYKNDPNFMIIMEDIDNDTIKRDSKIWANTKVTGSDHPCRIEQISNARNKLVSEFEKDIFNDYNLVVMIDLDTNQFLIDGILNSLELVNENPNQVIYANSIRYYDYYALRTSHSKFNLFGPELVGEHFWSNMNKIPLSLHPNNNQLFSVYSAFNGIGVYHKNVFKRHRYNAMITEDVKKVYNDFIDKYPNVYQYYKDIIHTDCSKSPGGIKDDDTMFYWKNNSGYDKPVICEHVSFNFSLINDGYKLYINPKMLYWWSN